MSRKVHKRNIRLYVNAGISYPDCRCGELLRTGYWITVNDNEVTCKYCQKRLKKE